MAVTNNFHCPSCGQQAACSISQEEDYWYTLAESFHLPATQEGVSLIKGIYEIWDPQEFRSFRDFVVSLKNG